jgi:uncharacterized protein (TIGR00369 family)
VAAEDGYCFVCGAGNPRGLGLSFEAWRDGVRAEFTPLAEHQGYAGVVHGGIISAILDEAMIKAAALSGCSPVTAELSVRFKKTLPVGDKAVVEAKLVRAERLMEASALLRRASDGATIASAKAKLLRNE